MHARSNSLVLEFKAYLPFQFEAEAEASGFSLKAEREKSAMYIIYVCVCVYYMCVCVCVYTFTLSVCSICVSSRMIERDFRWFGGNIEIRKKKGKIEKKRKKDKTNKKIYTHTQKLFREVQAMNFIERSTRDILAYRRSNSFRSPILSFTLTISRFLIIFSFFFFLKRYAIVNYLR